MEIMQEKRKGVECKENVIGRKVDLTKR